MAEPRSDFVVSMPSNLFTVAREFKACTNGSIFIGKVGYNPQEPDNQLPVYIENQNGKLVQVAQPIKINSGGNPVYNGTIAKFVVAEKHSMLILNSYGTQQFYFSNMGNYNPAQISADLSDLSDKVDNIDKGLVKTVNAISADTSGNVQVSAANVGAIPTTGGTVTGEIKSTAPNNFRITAGNRSFFLRYDGNDFYVMKTNAGDPDGTWDNDRPFRIGNDGAVYIEGERVTKSTSLNTGGWWKDERTGFMIQWGALSSTSNLQNASFPVPFPNSCFSITSAMTTNAPSSNNLYLNLNNSSSFNHQTYNSGCYFHWVAIGF
jgi:hypothetical protein